MLLTAVLSQELEETVLPGDGVDGVLHGLLELKDLGYLLAEDVDLAACSCGLPVDIGDRNISDAFGAVSHLVGTA